jgi:4-amino-4-deoxy-L-arabinose transferase-like glycosyltransferase
VRPDAPSRREWIWVAVLLGLALLLRAGFVLRQPAGFYFEDSLDYDRAARAYLDTGHFDARYYRSPTYPLLLAACYHVFGFSLTPFRLLQSLFMVGICLCVWILGRRYFGARAGLLALAGAAFFPVHVMLPGIEYPLVPGTFLIWVALALFARVPGETERKPSRTVVAGAAIGLAIMFFEGGLVAALFLLLWALAERRPWRDRARTASVMLLACLVTLSPWLLEMTRADDYRPLILRAGMHLPAAPGVNPPLWQGSGTNLLEAKLAGMASRPGWVIKYSIHEFLHFWDPYPDRLAAADPGFREKLHERDDRMVVDNPLVGDAPRMLYALGFTLLLLIALTGALIAGRAIPHSGFLIAWPIILGACYAPFFTQMRYRIPADPAFVILGAYAVELTLRRTLPRETWASLRALWEGWKRIALKIAEVQTFILLFLLFSLVLGPIGLLMRLFRKDPMQAPKEPGSLWNLRERTRERMEECVRQF